MFLRDMILVISGMGMAISLYALYTDYLGLEGYIEELKKDWIPPKQSIPRHIGLILIYLSFIKMCMS